MSFQPEIVHGSGPQVAIPAAGNTIIATIKNSRGAKYLFFQVDNAVSQALDAFQVLGRAHGDSQLADFSPAAWATPQTLPNAFRVKETSGNLAALASGASGWFGMDVTGLSEIVVQCSAAVNNASITPRWSLT